MKTSQICTIVASVILVIPVTLVILVVPVIPGILVIPTLRQNVYACARLSISGHFFSHTFLSDQSLPGALDFILCEACGSVVLLHAACIFDYFVVIEIAFMDYQAQISETIS